MKNKGRGKGGEERERDRERETESSSCSLIMCCGSDTLYWQDPTASSGKLRGGGLYIFVNDSWCTISKEVSRFYSPEVEYLMISCSGFYLESFHLYFS